MFGRANREQADERRALFLANREQVRSWVTNWHCPEITWPEVRAIPSPWVGFEEEPWLKRHAPAMDEYQWLLEAVPVAEGVTSVQGNWWFGRGHGFERLEILTRTVADPPYLAEMLALGAHAAGLKGWEPGDAQDVHEWLLEGLDSRPMSDGVRGKNRLGFVLLDFSRAPCMNSRTEINVRLTMTLTNTALDGSPLDGDGRTQPG